MVIFFLAGLFFLEAAALLAGFAAALLGDFLPLKFFLWASLYFLKDPLFSSATDSLRNRLATFSNLTEPVRTLCAAALLPRSVFWRSEVQRFRRSLSS